MTSRVLLTGASGFLGRAVLDRLRRRNDLTIHGVSSSRPHGELGGAATWHQVDLLDREAAPALIRAVQPTHLLHLAWHVMPGAYDAPENIRWVTASLDLVRAFAANGGRRAVVVGSGFEYDVRYGWCSEDLTPCRPHTVYGRSKQALHTLATDLCDATDVSLAWARVFFTYGPHEHPRRLVSSVISSLLAGRVAETTHGQQVRDYLHVSDVAGALQVLLEGEFRGSVNIGSGKGVAVAEIVSGLADRLGARDRVAVGARPTPPDDPPFVVADVRRMSTEVGYRPQLSLADGLDDVVAWWRAHSLGGDR